MDTEPKRLFVLDTNVLMHDSYALFKFQEHDIFLPMVLLEEMDTHKKGLSEPARNVRQVNRFLDKLLSNKTIEEIMAGIPLTPPSELNDTKYKLSTGRLFFQTHEMMLHLPETLPGNKPDNSILATVLALKEDWPDRAITLVSKDINLRIKATILGLHAEDYYNDRVMDDLSVMTSGFHELPTDFWETTGRHMTSEKVGGRTLLKWSNPNIDELEVGDYVYSEGENPFEAVVRNIHKDIVYLDFLKDYRHTKNSIMGIVARNREQNFALNALLDPDTDFVCLLGAAGTGKTLLTLAAALAQVIQAGLYHEIIVTRITVPLGEDIGFLPGTEEEKMTPWMGAFIDNLEVLAQTQGHKSPEQFVESLLNNQLKIRSLNFMRGRTFLNKFIILDEAQNLTSKQMQALVTRAGPGTKIVCLGNISQIDTPYLTEVTSGLTYVVQRFRNWAHSSHIVLSRGERSRLADYATQVL